MRFYGEDWDFCCSCAVNSSKFIEQYEWVTKIFGERGVGWNYYKARMYFKNEHDKMLFLLRWK